MNYSKMKRKAFEQLDTKDRRDLAKRLEEIKQHVEELFDRVSYCADKKSFNYIFVIVYLAEVLGYEFSGDECALRHFCDVVRRPS